MKGSGPSETACHPHRNAYDAGYVGGFAGKKSRAKRYTNDLRGWYKMGRREGKAARKQHDEYRKKWGLDDV